MSGDDSYPEAQPLFVQRPLKAQKGRGAVSNLQGRYETLVREAIDDGWSHDNVETDADADA
ncbi:MAG: radical SAM protein, partial [Nitrosospira sp.]|nr:radical SAM protein [Nitrosospira sp.]